MQSSQSTAVCESTPLRLFLAGARDVSPILLGIAPFGTIAGVSTAAAGFGTLPGLGMALAVFGGASQLAAVDLVARGAAPAVVILAALVVNLRYLMYSAGLAPHLSPLSAGWKGLGSYLMTDQAYAVSIARHQRTPDMSGWRWYYLGTAFPCWLTFQTSFAAGLLLGVAVPASWSLGFAIPLTFIALLLPAITDRPTAVAAVCGGGAAVVLAGLPYHMGLVVAATIGIGSGLVAEARAS